MRTHHLHARNEQWSILIRCPWPWLPLLCLRRAAGQLRYAASRGPAWVLREPRWWLQALRGLRHIRRRPVSWKGYRLWLSLLRSPRPVA
jgi:hypothetical protein